jgi:hypothetical protein
MYNRPICGRSTGAYTNIGDLQRDLMAVKSHPTKKKRRSVRFDIETKANCPLNKGFVIVKNIYRTRDDMIYISTNSLNFKEGMVIKTHLGAIWYEGFTWL